MPPARHGGEPSRVRRDWTDLHVDPLDKPGTLGGGIWHATLSVAEVEFVFDLCVATNLLVVNHQGGGDSPMFLVPRRNHEATELEALVTDASYLFVESADDLRDALLGDLDRFIEFRDRVVGRQEPPAPATPDPAG